MNKTKKILQTAFWVAFIVPVVAFILSMLIQPAFFSESEVSDTTSFVTLYVMEIATIILIPASLTLFRNGRIACELENERHTALLRYGLCRILMLAVPLWANTIFYYLYRQPAYFYLAVMLLLALLFIYPSDSRCRKDTDQQTHS